MQQITDQDLAMFDDVVPALCNEVAALRKQLAALGKQLVAKEEALKDCKVFLGETIQCGVEGEMLDGRHVNVAASDLADKIDEVLKGDEAAIRPVAGMTFGMAIEAMKRGKKVARRGWNGKGMWLCVPLCDGPKEIPADGIWGKPNAEYAEQNGGTVKVVPYVTMKAADGTIVMGWLASQTDMLSDDWVIVE